MSSRSLLFLVALAAVVVAPAASAQTAPTLTIEIQDLPATAASNGTALIVNFTVQANVASAAPCFSQAGSSYTITLAAEVLNSTGNSTMAIVNPKQYTIAGPNLLPGGAGSGQRTTEAQLTVFPGPYAEDRLNATVQVTASFAGGASGCTGSGAIESTEDTAELQASFEPVPAVYGNAEGTGQAMPGPGAVLLMVALGAVAILSRRKAA
jgi:hypothetical protein